MIDTAGSTAAAGGRGGSRAIRANRASRTTWATRAIGVAAVALVLAGCAGAPDDGTSTTSRSRSTSTPTTARPDEGMRNTIKTALLQAGRTQEADIVARGGARLTPVAAPFLKTWRIVQVDYRQGAHPVMFHVAVGGGQARLLTGTPEAFSAVTAADGTHVADGAAAARLGRTYLETTRPAGKLTYVIGGVNEIRFRPGITGSAARRRDEIVAKYRSIIKPPVATATGGGFTVVAYVVQDRQLQRRDLTVGTRGAVEDESTTLVPDLPAPYVL